MSVLACVCVYIVCVCVCVCTCFDFVWWLARAYAPNAPHVPLFKNITLLLDDGDFYVFFSATQFVDRVSSNLVDHFTKFKFSLLLFFVFL